MYLSLILKYYSTDCFCSLIEFNKYARFDNGALKLPSNFAIRTSLDGIDASSLTSALSNTSPSIIAALSSNFYEFLQTLLKL